MCGLANEAIQKLLLEAELDLAKAVKIALSLEGADKSSRAIHGALVPATITSTEAEAHRNKDAVHMMRKDTMKPCYRCGRSGHSSVNVASRRQLATPVVRWAILPQLVGVSQQ